MRYLALATALVLVCCNASTGTPRESNVVAASPPSTGPAAQVDPADRACAQQTMASLVQAMNTSDEGRLRDLLRAASIGIGEPAAASPDEAAAPLLAPGRAGQRWMVVSLDVNGRGGIGGVNFGVRLRRAGP